MNEQEAHQLSTDWGQMLSQDWPWTEIPASQDALMGLRKTMRMALAQYLPDDGSIALSLKRDPEPLIHALAGEAIYTARCGIVNLDRAPSPAPEVEILRLPFDRSVPGASVAVRYWPDFGAEWRRSRWNIALAGAPLEVESEMRWGQRDLAPEEAFARATARQLGWAVPADQLVSTVAA